jgi:ATP-dependent 26S proteasome regulatory subunit
MTEYDPNLEGRQVIFVLRDWHNFIDSNTEHIDKQLILFESILSGADKTVVILTPSRWTDETVPKELNQHVRIASYPLPDKDARITLVKEIRHQFAFESDHMLRPEVVKVFREYNDDDIETYADACAGLTRHAIDDTLTMGCIKTGGWNVGFILDEKIKNVARAGFNLVRPSTGFENIGGLTPLKEWVSLISKRFTIAARDYGFIRNVRGLLMAGVPGCGKTAIAKAAANEMNMNILMVDATDLKGSLVGESEAKVHKLLEIAKAAAPLIVFVDEAEKLLGKSEGVHDGGAHDAVLGQFLTFMQEDDSGVFFVFTANNMNKFAPELIDRFEGRFFIDLPEPEEREEIIRIHLKLRTQDASQFDINQLIKLTAKFSGRNIEDGIEEAMTRSFSEDRPLEMKDLVYVFETLVPTSKTKKDEIDIMRSFVDNGSMRKANNPPATKVAGKKKGRLSIENFD